MRMILRASASILVAGVVASAGLAQEAAAPAPAANPQAPVAAGNGLQDIVVTAQRREESVQKSSLAIDVVGGKDLIRQGVSEARDLTAAVPSITISQAGTFTQTNLRGVGDFSTNGLAQLAVSYSVDGVVEGQAAGISSNFYDLARIEVLKGPQGTLYGRNATGGAVNIITNRPKLSKIEGYVTAEYGNFDDKHLTGAINLPLGPTVAVRGAVNVVDRDGYLSDGTDDDKRQAGRIQLLWEPSDRVNLRISTDYAHQGGKGGGAVLFPRQPGTGPWTAISDPINNAAIAAGTGGLHFPFLGDNSIDNKQYNVSAELNAKLGDFATLTIIPAYRHLYLREVAYETGFRFVNDPQRSRQTSVEARLGHQSDTLKWTVGGYYFNDDTRFHYTAQPLSVGVINAFNVTADIKKSVNRSAAVFGEATYSLTDRFRVIGGLRYTHDLVHYRGTYTDNAIVPEEGSPWPELGRNSFNAVTWKGGFEYDVAQHSMAYFTASKGYKSGGFFIVPGGDDNSYQPEHLTAFDAGIRNRFFDNTLQVNLEAFYWLYRNQQLSAVGFTAGGSIAYITRNAGSSNPRGADLDVVWKPTRHDTLTASASFIHARFKSFDIDFPAPLISVLRTGPDCKVPSAPSTTGGGLPVYRISCAGAPLPRTPDWSGSINYQHIFELADGANLNLNVGTTFATGRYLTSDFFTPETHDGGYALLNADLTWTAPNGKLAITGFGRNLTNHPVYEGGFADVLNGFAGPESPTFVERTIGAPRTYGVRVSINF